MRTAAVILVAAMAMVAGCASAPPAKDGGQSAADSAIKTEMGLLQSEVADLRKEMERLRMEVIRMDARVSMLSAAQGSEGTQNVGSPEGLKEFWAEIDKLSDVRVCWLGELEGVQFYLCPVTKEEETKIFRDQLGEEYAYMWLCIRNSNKSGTAYKFAPQQGTFTVEFEGEGGQSRFETSFDPREVIKVREMQLGTRLLGLAEHFEAKNVVPGQTMRTHVLIPRSVNFTKVKAVYMLKLKMQERKP